MSANAAAAFRADSASASASALDSRTEEEINRSVAELAARDKGLTLVVIAHRESSLEYCTRIITIGE